MEAWLDRNGIGNRKDLIDYANALVMKYGQAAGALACEMYDKTAEAQGKTIEEAEIAELPSYGEVARAINGTLKESAAKLPGTVARLTKQQGADTTLKNALRDGAQFAWIAGGGESCAFCIALAARGWQYMRANALKNGHAEHIHANCICQYAVRFDEKSGIEGYDANRYKNIYDSMAVSKSENKINTLRRLITGKNSLTLAQVETIIEISSNPQILGKTTPDRLKKQLEKIGFDVKPLGRGNLKNIPFEKGGGYRINYGGDGYFQYHPKEESHHKDEYYKITDGISGKRRYDRKGNRLNEKKNCKP